MSKGNAFYTFVRPITSALLVALFVFAAPPAHADCTGPDAPAGVVLYNTDVHMPQYCDGANWIATVPIPGAGGAGCTNPSAVEGVLLYNTDHRVPQYCDGANWIAMAKLGGTAQPPLTLGYFVMSNGTYAGNLGGLSGADSICLMELQTNDWLGKDEAGELNSARVKAFLCDKTTCNNLQPGKTYAFASAFQSHVGGDTFATDGSGRGPGFSEEWKQADRFQDGGGTLAFWTNRDADDPSYWNLVPKGTTNPTLSLFLGVS